MRRRDKVFLGLLWGALLTGLAWALSTQFRWVQENKPIQVQGPVKSEVAEPTSAPEGGTPVIGTVGEETVTSMSKGLDTPPPPKAVAKTEKKAKSSASK